MDNQSNPNWPNTPTSAPLGGTNPPPLNSSLPVSDPAPSPDPTFPTYSSSPANPIDPLATNMPPAQPDYLSPTPSTAPLNSIPSSLSTPSLDNPWNAPSQPPSFEGSPQNWSSSANQTSSSDTPLPGLESTPTPTHSESPVSQPEAAPTDLSHLISNNPLLETAQTPVSQSSENLVVPSVTPTPEVPTIPTQSNHGIPKWLIGVGIGLLIIVAGASAYFILGIGQPTKTNSVPAEVSKQTVKTPPPIATPAPPANPVAATGSANFGELQEGGTSPQATSAADILKQRQQAR